MVSKSKKELWNVKVAVLGAGAWGTAIATVLAENGHEVFLWAHEEGVAHEIQRTRINKSFLPDSILSEKIIPTTVLEEALSGAEWVCEAVPVVFLRTVIRNVKPYSVSTQKWVLLSKGIEQGSGAFPSDILQQELGEIPFVVLSGPSFAHDVAQQDLTGICIASHNNTLTQQARALFENRYFRVFLSDDVCGVQLCAALKNVITLVVGMLDGAGYGDNTKTLFLVAMLHEMREFVGAVGGKPSTADGLAGIGDLMLTALGKRSKNLALGKSLINEDLKSTEKINKNVVEGLNTVRSIEALIQKNNLHLPLFLSFNMALHNRSVENIIQLLRPN